LSSGTELPPAASAATGAASNMKSKVLKRFI
jgi:hypothetical protein